MTGGNDLAQMDPWEYRSPAGGQWAEAVGWVELEDVWKGASLGL